MLKIFEFYGISLALLSMASTPVFAEESTSIPQADLSLEAAVAEALQRSPEVQKAQAVAEGARWKKTEMLGAGFLPQLSISGNHYFTQQYVTETIAFGGINATLPGMYPADQISLDFRLPLFNGLANIRYLKAASFSSDAAEKDLNYLEFQVEHDVKQFFYQALAALQLQEVTRQNIVTLEEHLKDINLKSQGGVATRYDTLRIEVQLSEAKADQLDAEDNVLLTRKKLNQVLGLDDDTRKLVGTLPLPNAQAVKDIQFSRQESSRMDVQALELRAEAIDQLSGAQNAWLVPSISLGGQYMYYNSQIYSSGVINTGNFQPAYNVGLFVKWNLFDGLVSLSQAKQANAQAIQANQSLESARLKMPYDFAFWKTRLLNSAERFKTQQLNIARSQESVRLAREEEKAGTRTSSDVLDAELDLIRARAGAVNSQLAGAEAQIKLELALGRKI